MAKNLSTRSAPTQKDMIKVSDNGKWHYEKDNKDNIKKLNCNYYIAFRLLLEFTTPSNMSFLLDFKLKAAKSLINKIIDSEGFEIDPGLQSMIDKIKSWKVKKKF